MKKHRGLFLGLGLAALVAMAAPEAQAGNLTITLTWTGGTLSFDYTSADAGPGSTADLLNANISPINAYLASHGSAYSLVSLGASSNNPGSPGGANVTESGAVKVTQAGATDLTIVASQTAFTSPSGPVRLANASSALFADATPGDSQTSYSSFNTATTTPPITYTYNGASNPQGFEGSNSMGGLTAPATGYTLDATSSFLMSPTLGATDRFSNTGVLTAVPEPAGLIMMVAGMPLPLVVMGLLRRRRAAA